MRTALASSRAPGASGVSGHLGRAILLALLALFGLALPALHAAERPVPDAAALNTVIALPLFADESLWDDPIADVAKRLEWPAESRTSSQSSYRLYANGRRAVLGADAWSLTLYGTDATPNELSMVFLNKGDHPAFQDSDNFRRDGTLDRGIARAFGKALDDEAAGIARRLDAVLGPSRAASYGQGNAMRERVRRWDWRGHAILLALSEMEYVLVRVLPVAVADLEGKPAERVSDHDMREQLKARVVQRANGDVLVGDIPMVDQGPKGYCVPATWERYLRYMGIPADMYVLAMAGETRPGGGTVTSDIADGARTLVRRYNRKLRKASPTLSINNVSDYIDKGLPLMWGMYVDPTLNDSFTTRSAARQSVTDWRAWSRGLDPARKAVRRFKPDTNNGHVCMIIGYNAATGEIAISDSWGERFAERWITLEEAKAISNDELELISW